MYSFLQNAKVSVIFPLLLLCVIAASLIAVLRRRNRISLGVFEIGGFFVIIVGTYGAMPLLNFLIHGLSFGPIVDPRLSNADYQDVSTIAWYYVIYLLSVCVFYSLFRGTSRRRPVSFSFVPPNRNTFLVILGSYLFIRLFLLFIGVWFGVRNASSYADSYLVYNDLPLIFRQLANMLSGSSFAIELLLLLLLLLKARRKPLYRWVILGWLVIAITMMFFRLDSRAGLMHFLLSLLILYHYVVRPLRLRTVMTLGGAVLILFVVLGIVREGSIITLNPLEYGDDTQSLFANALDLRQRSLAGATSDVFPLFYVSDVLRFVPQQLLPFEKLSLPTWYVETFYPKYAQIGGGFDFGAISEAVIGFGIVDVIWRGAATGLIFGLLHRWFVKRRRTFWNVAFYVWTTVMSYQTFRSTTFSLLPNIVYMFLLPTAGIAILLRLQRTGRTQQAFPQRRPLQLYPSE